MVEIFYSNPNGVDTSTLAASTVVQIDLGLSSLNRNFVLKNLRSIYHVNIPDPLDECALILAYSDASDADIEAALTGVAIKDIEDVQAYKDGQLKARGIIAIEEPPWGDIAGAGMVGVVDWKLPPKGIPALKGDGFQILAYNLNTVAAFTNGPTFRGLSKWMGAWF